MKHLSLLFLVFLVSISFAQEACVGNVYVKSSLLASIDTQAKVAVINFFVDDEDQANIPNAPILVYMTDEYGNPQPNVEKVYTDVNGEARYDLKQEKCLNYYFVYCPHDDEFSLDTFARCTQALVGQSIESPTSSPIDIPLAPAGAQEPKYVLQSVAQLSYCPPPAPIIPQFCLPIFAIFAFLGAALFMSGQNPLRAFDLTTPKLKPLGTRYMARGRGFNLAAVDWANSAVASGFQGAAEGNKVATSGTTTLKDFGKNIAGVWGGKVGLDVTKGIERVGQLKEINKVNMGNSDIRQKHFFTKDAHTGQVREKIKDELDVDKKRNPGIISTVFQDIMSRSRYSSLDFGIRQGVSKISDMKTLSDYDKLAPQKLSVAGKEYELRYNVEKGVVEAKEIGAKDASWKSIDADKGLLAAFSSLAGHTVFANGANLFTVLLLKSTEGGKEGDQVFVLEKGKWVTIGESKEKMEHASAIVGKVAEIRSDALFVQAANVAKQAEEASLEGLRQNKDKLEKATEYLEQRDEVKRLEKEGGSKSEIKEAREKLESMKVTLFSEYHVDMVYIDSKGVILREEGTGRILTPDDDIPNLKARLKLKEDNSDAVRWVFAYDTADASKAYDAMVAASGGTTQSMQFKGGKEGGQQLQYTGQEASQLPGLQVALLTIDDPLLEKKANIDFRKSESIKYTAQYVEAAATSYSIISAKMNDLSEAYADCREKDKTKAEKLEASMITVSNMVSKMITSVEIETKPGEKITVQSTNGAEVLLSYYAAQVRDGNVDPPKELMSQYVKVDVKSTELSTDTPVVYSDKGVLTTGFFNPEYASKREVFVPQEIAPVPSGTAKPEPVALPIIALITPDKETRIQMQAPDEVGPQEYSKYIDSIQRGQLNSIGNRYLAFAPAYDVAATLPQAQRQQFVEATTGEIVQRAVQTNDMPVISAYNFYLKRTEEAVASGSKQLPETPMLLRAENTFVKIDDPATIEKLFLHKTDSIPVVYSSDPNNPDESRLGEYSRGRELKEGESMFIPAELARRAGIKFDPTKPDATLKTGSLASIEINLDDEILVTQRLYLAAEYYTEGAKFFDYFTPVGTPKLGVDVEKPVAQQVKERMVKETTMDPFLARSSDDVKLATKRFGEHDLQVEYAEGKPIGFDRVKDPRKKA